MIGRIKVAKVNVIALSDMNTLAGINDITQEFEKFWSAEQQKAFQELVKTENLSKECTQALIENYLYSEKEPMRDDILELLLGDRPTLLQRKSIGDRILKKIVGFVETFIDGISGT